MNMGPAGAFDGAKVVLFLGQRMAVILRDDIPTIPFPAHWDLPGGGREGHETPFRCVQREVQEELGLTLQAHHVWWRKRFPTPSGANWLFAARLPAAAMRAVHFGSEGQRWEMMSLQSYLAHPRGIDRFKRRMRTIPRVGISAL